MNEPTSHAPWFIKWLLDHWEVTVFVLSAAVATFVGWMKLTFAPHHKVVSCKDEIVEKIEKHEADEMQKFDRYAAMNSDEHKEIKSDIGWIRAELSELKSLLIRLGHHFDS